MKIVRLKGGLGNQLFIIAKALHLREGEKIIIDARATSRKDRLPDIGLLRFLNFCYISASLSNLILRVAEKCGLLYKSKIYIDEYFQEPSTIELLKTENVEKLCAYLNLFPHNSRKECVVHIRLGDFLEYKPEELLSPDYYSKKLALVPKEYPIRIVTEASSDELMKFGFGAILNNDRVCISNNSEMLTDFKDIASAEIVICSNSTFCFWAAFLGHRLKQKKNVYLAPALIKFETVFET